MLTEVSPTLWAVVVNGRTVATNLPSRLLAESTIMNLPPEQRQFAQAVPVTSDGKTVLFG